MDVLAPVKATRRSPAGTRRRGRRARRTTARRVPALAPRRASRRKGRRTRGDRVRRVTPCRCTGAAFCTRAAGSRAACRRRVRGVRGVTTQEAVRAARSTACANVRSPTVRQRCSCTRRGGGQTGAGRGVCTWEVGGDGGRQIRTEYGTPAARLGVRYTHRQGWEHRLVGEHRRRGWRAARRVCVRPAGPGGVACAVSGAASSGLRRGSTHTAEVLTRHNGGGAYHACAGGGQ